jgi:hypothetical protein
MENFAPTEITPKYPYFLDILKEKFYLHQNLA